MTKDQGLTRAEGEKPGRRTFTDAEKQQIVEESFAPGASVSVVSRRHDINANLIFKWRRRLQWHAQDEGAGPAFLPVTVGKSIPSSRSRQTSRAKSEAGVIEVDLASGHRLRIEGAADASLVECVLRMLVP